MVDRSLKAWKPPWGPTSEYTPVECEYSPVRMVARLGQHRELTRKALANVMPWATRSRCTIGMAHSVSHRWSSVRTSTMLGPDGRWGGGGVGLMIGGMASGWPPSAPATLE